MVGFFDPTEYFYGTDNFDLNEQAGMYNRHMVGIRVENVPKEKIVAMDEYFRQIENMQAQAMAKFSLALAPLSNFIRRSLPIFMQHIAERGNCARWSSKGLVHAGVLNNHVMWPKSVWIHMFEDCPLRDYIPPMEVTEINMHDELNGPENCSGQNGTRKKQEMIEKRKDEDKRRQRIRSLAPPNLNGNSSSTSNLPSTSSSTSQACSIQQTNRTVSGPWPNIHVVSYRRIPHAHHTYARDKKLSRAVSSVTPFSIFRNVSYYNLEKFADVIVEVPEGTVTAVVRKNRKVLKPSGWRYYKYKFIILGLVILVAVGCTIWLLVYYI